jgi:FtsZ-binding cell division protein ZapB
MTAILATFGAVFSYLGAAQQAAATDAKNDAILAKNQAIQSRTQAANQWSFYQAKSTKQNLSELGSELASNDILKEKYRREATRYQAEKEAIKQKAESLDQEAEHWDARVDPLLEKSAALMHPHHVLAQAITLIQISIALASICALTKVRALFWASAAAATLGILLAAWAFLSGGNHHPSQQAEKPENHTSGPAMPATK